MRFALTAASVLFAGFVSTVAFADEAAPPAPAPAPVAAAKKMPLRVVRVLTETHQALLFDKTKGTHVLVEMGKEIDGFKVDDIDEDTVTLTPIEGGAQVVLAGPDPSWRRHREEGVAKPAAVPEDPYVSSAAPMDPYGDDTVRSAEAPGSVAKPITAGDGGVRTAEAPGSANANPAPRAVSAATGATIDSGVAAAIGFTPPPATAPAAPAFPKTPPASPSVDTSSAWSTPDAPVAPAADLPTTIAKADVTAALSNFGALAGSVRGSFTPTGAKLDSIPPDSLLAKTGLRSGDVITSINNQPLRSLDDAANLYARAGTMKAATIQIQRAGKPMTLRLTIQ